MAGSWFVKILLTGFLGIVGLLFLISAGFISAGTIVNSQTMIDAANPFLILGVIGFFSIIGIKVARFVL